MWYASCDDIDRLALVEALGAQDVWRRLEVLRVQPSDGMQEGVRGKVVLPSVKRVELAGAGVRRVFGVEQLLRPLLSARRGCGRDTRW